MNTQTTQRGYTLIELMIALTIGAFLTGGLLQLYIGSKRSYNVQNVLGELQEVGRYSLTSMVSDIRMAGFMGCGASAGVVNVLNGATANWEINAETALRGFEGGVSTFPADFSGDVIAGTDAITILRAVPDDAYVVQSHVPATATITLKNAHDLQQSEVLAITDCLNTSVFQMTNANAASTATTVVHDNTGTTPGNCTRGLGSPLDCATTAGTAYQYDTDAFVMRIISRAYYIGTGASGRNALFRLDTNNNGALGAPIELAEGVQDMQLVYGVDSDGDGAVDAYQRADSLTAATWGNVLSVQVNVLVESEDDRLSDAPQSYVLFDGTVASATPVVPTDNRLRRVYSSTTTVRNRAIL
ncbi:MAG: PilW family protein [Pseudomonadota bacterium]